MGVKRRGEEREDFCTQVLIVLIFQHRQIFHQKVILLLYLQDNQ